MAFLDILDDPMDDGSAVLFAPLSDADMARLPVWLVPESTFSRGARAADVPFHLDGPGALCVHGGTSQYATVTVPRGALLCHRNGTAMRQRAGVFDRGTVVLTPSTNAIVVVEGVPVARLAGPCCRLPV